MTLTATYDSELSRVRLVGSDLADGTVHVERSINEILWTTVRGGSAVEVDGGTFSLDDYEFIDGVENFYRITEAVAEEFQSASENQTTGDPWPVPPNVRNITVQAWGAGGAGQGNLPPEPQRARAGGGGGAYALGNIDVNPGENLLVRVGEGGHREELAASGQDGTDSTVFRGDTPLVEASAGEGSSGNFTTGSGGSSGSSIGDITFSGGSGGARTNENGGGGGGGGSAFADADGEPGRNAPLVAVWEPGAGGVGGEGEGDGGDGGHKGLEVLEVVDEFERIETDTWGTTTSGHEWDEEGGSPSDSQVDGSAGIVTLQADPSDIRYKRILEPSTDGEFLVSISPDQIASGGNFFPGFLLRYQDNSNFYRCRMVLDTAGDIHVHAVRVSTLIGSEVNTGLTYSPDDILWFRVRIANQNIRARIWHDGTDEPDEWMLNTIASVDTIDYGSFGMTISASAANDNVDPTFTIDNFQANVKAIAADTFDFFDRTETGTWGTSSSLDEWIEEGGLVSNRDVSSGDATMLLDGDTTEFRHQTVDVDFTDCEILTSISIDQTASGGTLMFGPTMRFIDSSNYYIARIHFVPNNNIFLTILTTGEGQLGGGQFSGVTYSPDDIFFVRIRVEDQTIRVRIWPDEDEEPTTWQIERTTTVNTIESGRVGLTYRAFPGNDNVDPIYTTSHFLSDPVSVQPIIEAENGQHPGGGGGGQADIQGTDNDPVIPPRGGNGADGRILINSWIEGEEESTSVTPDLEEQVWLKSIRFPFLNRPVECTPYSDIVRPFRGSVHNIKGRNVPIAVVDRRGSRQFTITIVTRTLEDARNLDLTFAANTIMFLHTPREDPQDCERTSAVPGGYVVIRDTVQRRALPGSSTFAWDLPCQVVAAPQPDIVGTTMTWGTVLRLYDSWESLIASNPTWRDLVEQVGSPEDLVVL